MQHLESLRSLKTPLCSQIASYERQKLLIRFRQTGSQPLGQRWLAPDELARCVLRLAMEGERDPVRLHDGALEGLIPATTWRETAPRPKRGTPDTLRQ